MSPTRPVAAMPCFLRRWVARPNHEGRLRGELVALHTAYAKAHDHLVEATLYREHFSQREFLGVAAYDKEDDVASGARQDLLAAFARVEEAHAESVARSLRVDTVYEYRAIAAQGAHGAAVVLRSRPDAVAAMITQLGAVASDVVARLAPSRMIVHHAVDDPGLFFTICDAEAPIDLSRYLGSSLVQEHRAAVGSLILEHARWFSLDPLWHYFRLQRAQS